MHHAIPVLARPMPWLLAILACCAWVRAAGAQTVSYPYLPDEIGSGLQSNNLWAQLSDNLHGGITVRIESGDTTLAYISDAAQSPGAPYVDVFVPNGSYSAAFWVQTVRDTVGTVTITASAPGYGTVVDSIDVVVPAIRLFNASGMIDVNGAHDEFIVQTGLPTPDSTTLTAIQAVSAKGSGFTVTVRNANAAAGQLVTTALTGQVVTAVALPGQSSTPSTVAQGGVAFDGIAGGMTEVTASISGFIATSADTNAVTVVPSTLSFSLFSNDVGSGLQTDFQVVSLSGSEHGGVTVHIEPQDTTLLLVSTGFSVPGEGSLDIFVPNGQSQPRFYLQGLEEVAGSTAITASAPGFGSTVDTIRVVTPGHKILNLPSTVSTLDPNQLFMVQVGLPQPDNSTLKSTQWARAGGPGLTVTLASSDTSAAALVTNASMGDTVTAVIAPESSSTPNTFGAGGVALDPHGAGTTLITTAIPGFAPTTAGSVDVTVNQPGITLGLPALGVGSGLLSPLATLVLGATGHGGVTARIVSTDPGIALVSVHPDSVGQDSVEVFVPNGSASVYFYVHGLEDTTGTVTLTATAPGFADGSDQVDIVQPVVGIQPNSLGASLGTLAPPDEFYVVVGVPNGPIIYAEAVRPGSTGVLVTASVDDSTLASLITLSDTSHTATVLVPEGASYSKPLVSQGGIALDGLNSGTVTVSVTAPGFGMVPWSTKAVTINAPVLSIPGFQDIGAGLQSGAVSVGLSASAHGGVTVHMESQDSTLSLVSTGQTDPGIPAADVFVPDGMASAVFYIQGVDAAAGTTSVAVSAPQFEPDTAAVTVVQPGVEIALLGTTLGVGEPDDEFRVRVGIPSAGNGMVAYPQARRGGGDTLVVAVTSSDTTAARLNTLFQSGDSVTVFIAPGEYETPPSVAASGVALQAVATGQTMVFASVPGFIQTGAAQQTVTVQDITITFVSLPATLGLGLETDVVTAQLGNGSHGGITVHVAVDDTTNAVVSSSALALGGASVDIPLLTGETDAAFYVQALGAGDTVRVTASAPGFTARVDSLRIVPAGLAIGLLADTLRASDPDDPFVVGLGAILPDSSGIAGLQLLRPGLSAVSITATSSDTAVGALNTLSTTGDSATATINVGEGETPLTVGGGGMAFDPRSTGSTLVQATSPGWIATRAGSMTVTVTTAVGIALGTLPSRLQLMPAVPNPFHRATTIRFVLGEAAPTTLSVFDVRGRRVATLLDRMLPAGPGEVEWLGRDRLGRAVKPGVYFYRLKAGPDVRTSKMVLLPAPRDP